MAQKRTTPEKSEWVFENEKDDLFKVETKRYDNGQVMKRCTLSDGRVAISRKLKGSDLKEVRRLTGGDSEKYQNAIVAKCVTLDDKPITIEEIDDLWMDDATKIVMMASINFPSTQNG